MRYRPLPRQSWQTRRSATFGRWRFSNLNGSEKFGEAAGPIRTAEYLWPVS